jgi:hypothetical protein
MKPTLKILKLLGILIITISLILISASFLLQDKVADIILKSLNKNISTKLEVGSIKLSFLRKFPKASLELKDVLVHSSKAFSPESFKITNTDTLLSARFVTVDFKISDILKGIYNIERVGIRSGKINLYTDSDGFVNYDISVKKQAQTGDVFTINLEKISLTNIKTCYNNKATKLIINGFIKEGKLKSRITGSDIFFSAKAALEINNFQLFGTRLSNTVNSVLDLTLLSSKSGIQIKKGVLEVENYNFSIKGSVSSDKMIDLNITGKNVDLSKIRNYLPEKYRKLVSEYNPSGLLAINSSIKGPLSRKINPHTEISFLLNKGHVSFGKSAVSINDLSFAGSFTNGSHNRTETSSVLFKDIQAKLGTAEYTGSLKISDFDNPKTELILKGKVIPGELKEFFDLQNISTSTGSVDMDLKLKSNLWPIEKITLPDFIDMKPEVDLVFNSLDIRFRNDKFMFNNINGTLSVSDSIRATNFQFNYKGQKIKLDGEYKNLPEWLTGRPVKLIASGDVYISRFIPELFFKNLTSSDSLTHSKTAFSMPDDLILNINFKIDSLNYKSFSSSKIAGSLTYKSRLLTFKSLSMESLNGMISGNGFFVQNKNKSLIARGSFNIADIDVNKTFITFHNFGQDFIKAENLKGSLSGSLALLLPMDSLLNPLVNSVTAEGKYLLTNGALIDFDPVKHLSTYIELSELENINFEQLENDFFIKNSIVYVPQMDIKSSAADLSVNGKHGFDNNYEYHVKILLSELLSRKRKKNKNNVTEFGVVKDDGLGRTSLLLKIESKGKEVKVGYDLKAATGEVKNNIKRERQTLKTILNQEYGWYKNDSIPKQEPVEKKSRFRISWDETESVNPKSDTPVVKKASFVKSLFKKK